MFLESFPFAFLRLPATTAPVFALEQANMFPASSEVLRSLAPHQAVCHRSSEPVRMPGSSCLSICRRSECQLRRHAAFLQLGLQLTRSSDELTCARRRECCFMQPLVGWASYPSNARTGLELQSLRRQATPASTPPYTRLALSPAAALETLLHFALGLGVSSRPADCTPSATACLVTLSRDLQLSSARELLARRSANVVRGAHHA